MAQIIKTYTETLPECRFMGIRYGEGDQNQGSFAHLWDEWFLAKRFEPLARIQEPAWKATFPEADSYIGLMRMGEGVPFEYWIGMFFAPGTPEMEGYQSLDFGTLPLGVCWVQGKPPAIYQQCEACIQHLTDQGHTPVLDEEGGLWLMERYQRPRFTQADDKGDIILDVVVMLQEDADTLAQQDGEVFYCAHCRKTSKKDTCSTCGRDTKLPQEEDPIYMGELPASQRNALQIAFSATDIPFTALSTLGSGFTLSAGEIFETYKVYVPYARSREAQAAFDQVMARYDPGYTVETEAEDEA